MQKKSIFTSVFLVCIFFARQALATSCMMPSFEDSFARVSLIFSGKAVNTGYTTDAMQEEFKKEHKFSSDNPKPLPDTYTDFEVLTQYKGVPYNKFRIYYTTGHTNVANGAAAPAMPWNYELAKPFATGEETTISADNVTGVYITYRGMCSVNLQGSPDLKIIKDSYEALDELIRANPGTVEFYTKKAALQERRRDFGGAAFTLETLLTEAVSGQVTDSIRIAYGRNLYSSGRYEDALKVLEPLQAHEGAIPYIQLTKLQLGRGSELKGQRLQLKGQEIANLTIEGIDAGGSDFSGAKIDKVKFLNVKFAGADFSKASMSMEIKDSDFSDANFTDATVSGKLVNSHFDRAMFLNSKVNLGVAGQNTFNSAKFTNTVLQIADEWIELVGGKAARRQHQGNDFTAAKFDHATVAGLGKSVMVGATFSNTDFFSGSTSSFANESLDLSGQNFEGRKLDSGNFTDSSFRRASLKGATFTGANLTGADFYGADISGADFSTSNYSGATKLNGAIFENAKIDGVKWEGAIFDCKTRFPQGLNTSLLEPADLACAMQPPLGAVLYSKDRFYKGNINVCNGDYHAACIYSFIVGYALIEETGGYSERRVQSFLETARSLIDADETHLAQLTLYRLYAEFNEIAPQYAIGPEFSELLQRAGIDFKEPANREYRDNARRPMMDVHSPQRDEAMTFLQLLNKEKAREAATKGLSRLKNSPASGSKRDELLVYADIFGKIDGPLKPELVLELEKLIRTTPYLHFEKQDKNKPEPIDYVAEGQKLMALKK